MISNSFTKRALEAAGGGVLFVEGCTRNSATIQNLTVEGSADYDNFVFFAETTLYQANATGALWGKYVPSQNIDMYYYDSSTSGQSINQQTFYGRDGDTIITKGNTSQSNYCWGSNVKYTFIFWND